MISGYEKEFQNLKQVTENSMQSKQQTLATLAFISRYSFFSTFVTQTYLVSRILISSDKVEIVTIHTLCM